MNNVRTYFTMDDVMINVAVILEREVYGRALSSALIGKYSDNWIVYSDKVDEFDFLDPDEELAKKVESWRNKFMFIYNTTKDRYEQLISLYEQEKDNLFAKIGSKTTTKFNDTPQNGGDFSSDDYTTNITQSETEVMPAEVMDRLENIHSKFKNLYAEWCDEFKPLFGEEL